MKNIVFTIVAKNYLPLARTLGDSVMQHKDSNTDFIIFIVDELDKDFKKEQEKYEIIEANSLNIPNFKEMSFKYEITEFSTAIKPFVISHLFKLNYRKVIYFDPDIYVYNTLNTIFDELDNYLMLLTPHLNYPIDNSKNAVTEETVLWSGIYNLGFIAVKNSIECIEYMKWWESKLYVACYADKGRGLSVDQKWMDFAPNFLREKVLISSNSGYNMAVWNLHERKLFQKNNIYYIKDKNNDKTILTFFHFSGFNYKNRKIISSKHSEANFINYPELESVFSNYADQVKKNDSGTDFNKPYTYDYYNNGSRIIVIQRRLYTNLKSNGINFDNPFDVGPDSFYELLRKNRVISNKKQINPDKVKRGNFFEYEKKARKINLFMRFLNRVLGIDKYSLLLRFLRLNTSYDAQNFLLKNNTRDFYNDYYENIK